MADRSVTIDLTREARGWLGKKGYDPLYGARPLGRVIQEQLKKPLAEELLFGQLQKGGVVLVDLDKANDKLTFTYKEAPKLPPTMGGEKKEPEYV